MLKKIVKKSFNLLGFDLRKLAPPLPPPVLHHKIDVIFDVGANTGQYALLTRKEGFKGRIVSFEPLPDAHQKLLLNAEKDSLWTVHPRCAVGSSAGTTKINISKNSYSSSILPMLDAHSSAAPESIYVGAVETSVITLESIFEDYRNSSERAFLKIDTQGFESEVLKGCLTKLPQIKAIQLELSTVPLYEGQELYRHFLDFFESNGFYLWSILPGFANSTTGQHLQFDAVFVNRSN
jgi:FkbM family methyltransferase